MTDDEEGVRLESIMCICTSASNEIKYVNILFMVMRSTQIDFLFTPHNYTLDSSSRDTHNIFLRDKIASILTVNAIMYIVSVYNIRCVHEMV